MDKRNHTDPSVGSYQSDKVYEKPIISQTGKKARMYEGIGRNPVIVIHGFLGAHLKNAKTGESVWGSFQGIDLIKGYSHKELQELSLPMGLGKSLKELRNDVHPTELLNTFDINLLGIHFKKDAYDKMINILEEAGYVNSEKPLPENKNFYSLFTFCYDWRRDLPENAALLHDFILKKQKYLQKKYKELYNIDDYDVHFDITAHSMGGLLSRYFLRYGGKDLPEDGSIPKPDWAGSNFIDKLIIIGTPNAGYLDTCSELINGLQIAKHTPFYPPAVIGTFHTYYQMMPLSSTKSVIYEDVPDKAVDMFNIKTWIDMKWGLANPEQDKYLKIIMPDISNSAERRNIALDHLEKCLKRAKQFTETMSLHYQNPSNVLICLFCGNAVETSSVASVNSKTGNFRITEYESGDGKVLASSARMDERIGSNWTPYMKSPINWDAVIHIRAAHMGITDSYGFANNLIYYLLGMPPKNYSERERFIVNHMMHQSENK